MENRLLEVGDNLYRVVQYGFSNYATEMSIERIARVTKTQAISHNGVRYNRKMYYNGKKGYYTANQYGGTDHYQYDRLLNPTEVDTYVEKVADFVTRKKQVQWVDRQTFTQDEKIQIFKLFNGDRILK